MKRLFITLLSLLLAGSLAGCSSSNNTEKESSSDTKESDHSDIYEIDFQIDQDKTDAYEEYFQNEREAIEDNDIVSYGKSGTGYIKRYTLYSDSSVGMETYCNYHDENGKRVCDSMVIYVNADWSKITVQTSLDSTVYYTDLTDSIKEELDLLSKEEINTLLDQATDFAAGLKDNGDEEECFQVLYKDTSYLFYDYSYINAEYDDTHTYSIDLGDYEGFLSIEKASEDNQETTCSIDDFSTFTQIDEKQFLENYNSFEE